MSPGFRTLGSLLPLVGVNPFGLPSNEFTRLTLTDALKLALRRILGFSSHLADRFGPEFIMVSEPVCGLKQRRLHVSHR